MNDKKRFKLRKIALLALKIGIGGSFAYYLATILGLQYAASAGTICLLTLQTTKLETLKLSSRRLLSFFMTFVGCMFLVIVIPVSWVDYGIYLFLLVFMCEIVGWRSVISVNAVLAAHMFAEKNFSFEFLVNEFLLVVIGVSVAIVLNLFHINKYHQSEMIKAIQKAEKGMQMILLETAGYLRNQSMGENVWRDILELQKELDELIEWAHEYQSNTFLSHPEYYVNYFEMRKGQCLVLYNLHSEMNRFRHISMQAEMVADYIEQLTKHVHEKNEPQKQIDELEMILNEMKEQPLPESREEFESRAMLYHILMDIEDFLILKKRFVLSINDKQYKIYWEEK